MKFKIIGKLKSEKGSSLAFVLIIGMVIMILVASLLAVANSDFTFTQQTVESRQAYIDAKSVIEYGKIEINSREKELSDKYTALVAAMNDKDRAGEIPQIKQKIADLENKITPIFGDENNVASTVSFSNDGTKVEIGKVFIVKTPTSTSTTDTSQYVFKVETESLRRKLDYQTDFKYVVTTTPGSPGTIEVPTKPLKEPTPLAIPTTNTSTWINTHITKEYSPNQIKCTIDISPKKEYTSIGDGLNVNESDMNLNVVDFGWANIKQLVLNTKNISFDVNNIGADQQGASFNISAVTTATDSGEIRFKKNFKLTQKSKMILSGKNIIFEGDLVIDSDSSIDINCDTLWIKGDFVINTNNKEVINRINAKNIIIGDYSNNNHENKLEINGASNVVWQNLDGLWIKGNFNINNWNSNNGVQNIINAKNIIIDGDTNKYNGVLNVTSGSKINFTCTENFWAGNIKMAANDSSLTSTIKAAQIIIKDTHNDKGKPIFIGDKTNVIWDATDFWVDGKITTGSTAAIQTFKNISYLSADDIELSDKSKLTIEGADGKKNQIIVGSIKVVDSNSVSVNISKLCYLTCNDLILNDNSTLKLNVEVIKINNNFELLRSGIFRQDNTLDITCESFECSGVTSINYLYDDLNFNPKNNRLNLRFFQEYNQKESTVNINGADKVIFGPSDKNNGGGNDQINLNYDSSLKLNIKSDNIYLASDNIDIENGSQFIYEGKTSQTTNLYIESAINKHGGNVVAGTYKNVVAGVFPAGLVRTGNYVGPEWPVPVPSCMGSGSSTLNISPGSEKYY